MDRSAAANATFDDAPRFLIRDGDGKFGAMFDDVASGADIEVILSLHPNMNPELRTIHRQSQTRMRTGQPCGRSTGVDSAPTEAQTIH